MATEMRPSDLAIGIDFGGSGIKGAVVDVRTGQFVGDRIRVPTPQPSIPREVVTVMDGLVRRLLEPLTAGEKAPLSAADAATMPVGVGMLSGRLTPVRAPAMGQAAWQAMHAWLRAHARHRARSTDATAPRFQRTRSSSVGVYSAPVGHTVAHRLQFSVQCAGRSSSIGVQGPASEVNETLGRRLPVGQAP